MSSGAISRTDRLQIRLEGEIDLETVEEVNAVLATAIDGTGDVVVDLTDLTFIGSTGLTALLAARQQLADGGRLLILRNPPRTVVKLLEVTGLAPLFDIEGPSTA